MVNGPDHTPQLMPVNIKISEPNAEECAALTQGGQDPSEYATAHVPSIALACSGIAPDGTLVFALQLALPPGMLSLQASPSSRILNPQGQAAGLMQSVGAALTGCRPATGCPPMVSMLIRKSALAEAALANNVPPTDEE